MAADVIGAMEGGLVGETMVARPSRRGARAGLAAVVAVWSLYAGGLLWRPGNLFLADTAPIDVPRRIHAAEQLRRGVFPWWTPDLACGFPLYAEGQTAILYPGFLIYVAWPTPKAHDVFIALHYLLAVIGMWMYLRSCRLEGVPLGAGPAALGAVFLMISPAFEFLHAAASRLQVIVWVPLALWLWHQMRAGSRRAWVGLALVHAAMIFAGSFDTALMCFTLEGLYALFLFRGALMALVPGATAAFGLALALAAVQLGPTYEYFQHSNRATVGGEPVRLPWWLVWSIAQQVYKVGADSAGLRVLAIWQLAVVALCAAAGAWQFRRTGLATCWTLLALTGALLSTQNPVSHVLDWLPGYSWFRWPSFYAFWFHLGIAVLAAIGSVAIGQQLDRHHRGLRPWGVACVVALVLLIGWQRPLTRYLAHGDVYGQTAPEIVRLTKSGEHARLWSIGRPPVESEQGHVLSERIVADAVRCAPPDYNLLEHVPSAQLYSQFTTVSPGRLTELYAALAGHAFDRIARVAAITHVASLVTDERREVAAWPRLPAEQLYLYRNPIQPPRGWIVGQTTEADRSGAVRQLASDAFHPNREALVEPGVGSNGDAVLWWPSDVSVADRVDNNTEAIVESTNGGLLLLADSYWPGRRVWVDEVSSRQFIANHAFVGVELPAGRHLVAIAYRSTRFWISAAISVLAGALVALGMIGPAMGGDCASGGPCAA